VAVTALEAHNPTKSLKFPAKYIAYITASIYFFSVILFCLNVSWKDPLLPSLEARIDHGSLVVQPSTNDTSPPAIVVIAVQNAGISVHPDILNGFLIMVVLSAANTALYVSSRTLFGLTRDLDPESNYWCVRWLSRLGTTTPRKKIPGWALVISALSFCWVPFLHLNKGVSDQDVQCLYKCSANNANKVT
jgi:amino acid transporter